MSTAVGLDLGKSSIKHVTAISQGEVPALLATGRIVNVMGAGNGNGVVRYKGHDYIVGREAVLGTGFSWSASEDRNLPGAATMTPSRAVKIECGVCRRDRGPCTSKHCSLSMAGTALQRIKAHCQNCAPDHRIKECTGQNYRASGPGASLPVSGSPAGGKAECPLRPFRYGRNQNLSRLLSEHQKKTLAERGQLYRFVKKTDVFSWSEGRARGQGGGGVN